MPSSIINKRGFTLIEIMVAMFFLLTALLGLLSLTTSVVKGNAFSKMTTMANTLAKSKIEELKGYNYDDLSAGSVIDYATTSGAVSSTQTGTFYTRTYTVVDDSPAVNMKNVTVQVGWSMNGTSHNVSTSTIVSR
ncbi:N-terminal methylation site-containing protein [Syntrophus gentianae]|uniref:N-terminal methylation site-containing protein n=1 Tax=Syntrophus gentianae TaxID=43775 RepID=A0A1H7VAU6_9BACT|nr:prepilin-type N-terminal cleavage/methylation domain-containing protein [Syntrophus gentianae]SEM06372.1 N-terminal methylation site-containing protein [Syntrophus gentianae]